MVGFPVIPPTFVARGRGGTTGRGRNGREYRIRDVYEASDPGRER